MKRLIVLAVLSYFCFISIGLARAEGGQIKQNNPLYNSEGEVIGIEVPTTACENYIVVPDQSGKVVYIICTEDE